MLAYMHNSTDIQTIFHIILICALGSCLGSFFHVCISRIPKHQSIIFPGSHCECGKKIPLYFNIPIISWLILRGRTKCCGRKLEISYLLLEIFTSILFVIMWCKFPPVQFCFYAIFVSILIISSGIDFKIMEIPDTLTIGGTLLGLKLAVILHIYDPHWQDFNLLQSASGLLIGSGLLLWIAIITEVIFKKETIGFGDIKLIGCIGAFIGTKGAIFSIFGGAFIGSVIFLPIYFISQLKKGNKIKFGNQLPFGPFLSLGAITYVLYFKNYADIFLTQLALIFI